MYLQTVLEYPSELKSIDENKLNQSDLKSEW
jgi:hypothetical protein